MKKLICIVASCPLRKEPSYASEIVSQLLFGETAVLLESNDCFFKVRCEHDNYEGWCMYNQVDFFSSEVMIKGYVTNHFYWAFLNGKTIYLPIGTPVIEDVQTEKFSLVFPQQNFLAIETLQPGPDEILHFASLFENVPYLWGGRSSYGIDCSGFVQQVYRLLGIRLPRDAYQQALTGEIVAGLENAKCGDLAFFADHKRRITHVGILLDSSNVVHAAGYVHTDSMDTDGIIDRVRNKRTHCLHSIRRHF